MNGVQRCSDVGKTDSKTWSLICDPRLFRTAKSRCLTIDHPIHNPVPVHRFDTKHFIYSLVILNSSRSIALHRIASCLLGER